MCVYDQAVDNRSILQYVDEKSVKQSNYAWITVIENLVLEIVEAFQWQVCTGTVTIIYHFLSPLLTWNSSFNSVLLLLK